MYINFSILNFFKRKNKWDKYFSFYKSISKNKHIEFEGFYNNHHMFSFEFKISHKQDHAGIMFGFNLLCYEITLQLYDSRHWDYINDCWYMSSTEEMVKNNFDGF
jgi:hypothetical protein